MELLDLGPLSARGVLLLHGSACPAASLVRLANELSGEHRVLLPDLPGYGKSIAVVDHLHETQAALETLLEDLGIVAVDLVGVSFGAYRALRLAASGAVQVRRVVLLGGFATLLADERTRLRALADKVRRHKDVCDDFLALAMPPHCRDGLLDVVERCRDWVHDAQKRETWAAELEVMAAVPDLRPTLAARDLSLLALHGEGDAFVDPRHSADLRRMLRDAAVEMLPCGHLLLDELPGRVINRVRKFLA